MTAASATFTLPPADATRADRVCRTAQILIVAIACLLHAVFLSKAKPLQSANDRSRWCTVWSLVERGTFQIDEIRQRPGWDTIDLVHVDNHFYSTKPPLLPSIVAAITWSLQRMTGLNLLDHPQTLTFLVLVIVNLIPFSASLLVWIALLERITANSWTRLFALCVASFATLLTPFLMTFNNHTVAAASTMFAIYGLYGILSDTSETRLRWPYALCGFTSAWAAANELPAGLLLVMMFVLSFRQSPRQTLSLFLPMAAIPLIALLASNMIATGSWKPFYAEYGTDKYRFVIDGVPSYWMQPRGIDRNIDSPWTYFLHCTIGHHGLFSLTPISLFAMAGWLLAYRVRDRALRALLWLGGFISVVVLTFYMTRTQNYNYGGVCCALRWALWLTPLWLVALVPALDTCGKSKIVRGIALVLAMVSIYSAWQPIDNPWRQPWLFQWMESRGWIDYSDPPPTLPKPLWTWFSSLPDSHDPEPAWIEFRVAQPGLEPRLVRLTVRQDNSQRPGKRLLLEVRDSWGQNGRPDHIRQLLIKVEEFQRGAPPADFVTWSDPNVTTAQQQSDLAFVRGLPRKVSYEARAIRYLKTGLRTEALRCVQASAHVAFAATESERKQTHRCYAWLSDDVPFGVAQVEFQINDSETAAILFQERWTLHDCSPKIRPYANP